MVNIKDIAKEAGVSISTVSYALNGNKRVSDATRQRILDIAKKLNYTPNAAGRNLKRKESKVIGAYINDYTVQLYGDILHGMRKYLNKNDYELVTCCGEKAHRFIPERMFDGSIILDWTFPNEKITEYADRGHKIVVLDRQLNHSNVGETLINNEQGARIATEYLIQKGFEKLYIVKGPKNNFDNNKRLQGVREVLSQNLHVDFVELNGSFDRMSGLKVAQQIASEYTEPVAVFCFNDDMAIGMYDYLKSTNLEVGKHVHIVGFDNIELTQFLSPTLTTIGLSREFWGETAAKQLLNMLKGQTPKNEFIDVQLIERDSAKSLNTL